MRVHVTHQYSQASSLDQSHGSDGEVCPLLLLGGAEVLDLNAITFRFACIALPAVPLSVPCAVLKGPTFP